MCNAHLIFKTFKLLDPLDSRACGQSFCVKYRKARDPLEISIFGIKISSL